MSVAILGETPLDSDHKDQLHHLMQEGVECLSALAELPDDVKDAAAVVQAIKAGVDAYRAGGKFPAEYEAPGVAAYGIGTLFAGAVQRASDWEWIRLRLGDGTETSALASPDRAHLILPHHYFYRMLGDSKTDNTVSLLFEMIRDKNLPKSEPGQLALLS